VAVAKEEEVVVVVEVTVMPNGHDQKKSWEKVTKP
jgi:hypothetical protein